MVQKSIQLANIACQLVTAWDPSCLFLQYLNGIICEAGGMKRHQWKLLAKSSGAVCSYRSVRLMIKRISESWVIFDSMHSGAAVVLSSDNLNWILRHAVVRRFNGNMSKPQTRAAAMITGQMVQVPQDQSSAADQQAYSHPDGPRRPRRKRIVDFKEKGDGLSQFELPAQQEAWDQFRLALLDVVTEAPIDDDGLHKLWDDRLVDAVRNRLLPTSPDPPKHGHTISMATMMEGCSATLADIEAYWAKVKADFHVGKPGGPLDILAPGDQQTYALFWQMKLKAPESWEWLHPYPGDWHVLLNASRLLLRPIWQGGGSLVAVACHLPTMQHASAQWKDCDLVVSTLHQALTLLLVRMWEQDVLDGLQPACQNHDNKLHRWRTWMEQRVQSDSNPNEMLRYHSQWWDVSIAYLAQYVAIRCSLWHLRGAAIRHLAPFFFSYRRFKYEELMARSITDHVLFPDHYLSLMEAGKLFTVSFKGRKGHDVAADEAHEMRANLYTKQHTDNVTEEEVVNQAGFINHMSGATRELWHALGFKEESACRKPQVQRRCVHNLLPMLAPIMHMGEAKLRRCSGNRFGADTSDLKASQATSLLSSFRDGEKSLRQYMRQVVMQPPYELKKKLPPKSDTFDDKATKASRAQRAQDNVTRAALINVNLKIKRLTGMYSASSPLPLAIAQESGAMQPHKKAKAFSWLRTVVHDETSFIKLQNPFLSPQPHGVQPMCAADGTILRPPLVQWAVVLDGLRIIHLGPLSAGTYREWWNVIIRFYVEQQFNRGATTVVLVIDRRRYLSKIRDIVHGDRAAKVQGHAPSTLTGQEARPRLDGSPPRGKALAAALGNPVYKDAVVAGLVNAMREWAAESIHDGQILVADTTGDCPPAVFYKHHDTNTDPDYILRLQQPHDKGEADYAMFLWARRVKEPIVQISANDTDVVFYALALVDGGTFPEKQVVIDRGSQTAPCFVDVKAAIAAVRSLPGFSRMQNMGAELLFMYLNAGADYTPSWYSKG